MSCNVFLYFFELKDIFKIVRQGVQQSKQLGATVEDMSELWSSQELTKVQAALASSDRFKSSTSLQVMCQQVLDSLRTATSQGKGAKKETRQPESTVPKLGSDVPKSAKRKVPDADHLEPKKGRQKKTKKSHDD